MNGFKCHFGYQDEKQYLRGEIKYAQKNIKAVDIIVNNRN